MTNLATKYTTRAQAWSLNGKSGLREEAYSGQNQPHRSNYTKQVTRKGADMCVGVIKKNIPNPSGTRRRSVSSWKQSARGGKTSKYHHGFH